MWHILCSGAVYVLFLALAANGDKNSNKNRKFFIYVYTPFSRLLAT